MQYIWNQYDFSKNEFLNLVWKSKSNSKVSSIDTQVKFDIILEQCLESNNLPIWLAKSVSRNEYFNLFQQLYSEVAISSSSDKFVSLFQEEEVINLFASFSYNNSIFTLVDQNNQVLKNFSTGHIGFKGHKRSSSFAAESLLYEVSRFLLNNNFTLIDIKMKGLGEGRKVISKLNKNIQVRHITDVTNSPHNGCRPRKKRRL